MVLRDRSAGPGRALATTLGIAGAVAILISGTWWRDAIDYLFRSRVPQRERQDVSLVLGEPASTSAVYDLNAPAGSDCASRSTQREVRLVHATLVIAPRLTGLAPGA